MNTYKRRRRHRIPANEALVLAYEDYNTDVVAATQEFVQAVVEQTQETDPWTVLAAMVWYARMSCSVQITNDYIKAWAENQRLCQAAERRIAAY